MKLLGHCRNALSTYSTRLDSQGFPLSSTTCYQVLFFSTKVFRPRFQVIRKYDINRLPATYWLATDVTQVMRAMPSQKSKPPFKKKKKKIQQKHKTTKWFLSLTKSNTPSSRYSIALMCSIVLLYLCPVQMTLWTFARIANNDIRWYSTVK